MARAIRGTVKVSRTLESTERHGLGVYLDTSMPFVFEGSVLQKLQANYQKKVRHPESRSPTRSIQIQDIICARGLENDT